MKVHCFENSYLWEDCVITLTELISPIKIFKNEKRFTTIRKKIVYNTKYPILTFALDISIMTKFTKKYVEIKFLSF